MHPRTKRASRLALTAVALAFAAALHAATATAHGGTRVGVADETRLSPRTQAAIAEARRATAAFHDFAAAAAAGYGPDPVTDLRGLTCIDNPGTGAMGVHFVNGALLTTALDARRPQALIYEPMPGGTMRLVGAEYIVFEDAWQADFPGTEPMLFDRHFHLTPAGNRYGLPPFYALHLWLWQPNPAGMLADWNPAVRCR
jgi:hypothetical protein